MKSRIRLFDAHLHLQDSRLKAFREGPTLSDQGSAESIPPITIAAQLTNGTHPDDWPEVAALEGEGVLKAYGVHPWKVDDLPDDWEAQLRTYLDSGAVSLGEIGLDRWIEPRDEDRQVKVFERQLAISNELNLPPTLHCLRAWGMLIDCLRGAQLPNGFLVHGFGGSKEVLYQLLDLGGYVSFSAYAAHPSKHRMREAVRACPLDRLLVETDAPDMVPPEEICRYPFFGTKGRLHDPREIETAYAFLADLKGFEMEAFAGTVERNFRQLFL